MADIRHEAQGIDAMADAMGDIMDTEETEVVDTETTEEDIVVDTEALTQDSTPVEAVAEPSEEVNQAPTHAPTSEVPSPSEGQPHSEPGAEVVPEEPVVEDTNWEQRYKDLQSYNDKRFNEISAQQKAQEDLFKKVFGDEEPDSAPERIDTKAMDGYIGEGVQNGIEVFTDLLSNDRFDAIPSALASIKRHHGEEQYEMASAAAAEARQIKIQAKTDEQIQRANAPQQAQQVMVQITDSLSTQYGEGFKESATKINELLQAEPGRVGSGTPAEIHGAMAQAYFDVRDQMLKEREAKLSQQPRVIPASENVPAGSPAGAPAVPSLDQQETDELGAAFQGLGKQW